VTPLVTLKVGPMSEQPSPAGVVNITGLPEPPPVAATVNELPNGAADGADVVTVIACAAFCAVVALVTGVAAL
jgi:hypothetical protein